MFKVKNKLLFFGLGVEVVVCLYLLFDVYHIWFDNDLYIRFRLCCWLIVKLVALCDFGALGLTSDILVA